MFEQRKKLEIRRIRELDRFVHSLSKLAIIAGGLLILAIYTWKVG